MPYPIRGPAADHGPSIKNPATYEALINERGMSKSQAAAISNAALNRGAKKGKHHAGRRKSRRSRKS